MFREEYLAGKELTILYGQPEKGYVYIDMNLIYLGATWSLLCTYCTMKTQTEATIYVNRCECARIKKVISMRHLSTLLLRSKKQKEKNWNRSWAAEPLTVNNTMPSSLSASHNFFDATPPQQAANPSVCLGLVHVACWSVHHFILHFVLTRWDGHRKFLTPAIFGPRQRSSLNLSHSVL